MKTETIEAFAEITACEEVVMTAMTNLNNGRIRDVIASFAEEFRFKDHGTGLDFNDKERLSEFFQKTREFYPDSVVQADEIFVSGDRVIAKWTLRATLTERFFGGLTRNIRISLQGVRVDRADGQRQDYRLGGLLRRVDRPPYALGFIFHRMGRTLTGEIFMTHLNTYPHLDNATYFRERGG